jgi:transcriptional regulator with XRE-family HTH domain
LTSFGRESILAVVAKNLNEQDRAYTGGDWSLNLRRLLYFHHATAREAAAVIGVTEQAISGWLRGTRTQSLPVTMRTAEIYNIDPRALAGDPIDFAQVLADPDRIRTAEANIMRAKRGEKTFLKEPPKRRPATVTKLQPRRKG